jgi:GR25 family glycosyltransferase involved in LPS biosynthesis
MPDIEENGPKAPGNSSSAATPPTGFAALWPLVDAVHCITLSTRPERRKALEPELAAVGLLDRAEYLVQEHDVADGKRGCFRAHQQSARRALERGAGCCLTIEDDCFFTDGFSPYAAARVARFLRDPPPAWQIFFLGHFPRKMECTAQPDVVRVRSMDAHCYLLSADGMRALSALEYRGDQVDVHFHYACEHAYALYPMAALQRASFSDTEGVQRADDWNDDKLARERELYRGAVGRQMLQRVGVGAAAAVPAA